jgi:hypothetical protein
VQTQFAKSVSWRRVTDTNDGTEPTAESTLYSEPFSIARTMTIKAIAILDGQTSPVASQLFTLNSNGE